MLTFIKDKFLPDNHVDFSIKLCLKKEVGAHLKGILANSPLSKIPSLIQLLSSAVSVADTWELDMLHKLRQTRSQQWVFYTVRTMGHSWPCRTSFLRLPDVSCCDIWSFRRVSGAELTAHTLDTGWFTGKCVNSSLPQASAVDYSISLYLCCFETSPKRQRELLTRCQKGKVRHQSSMM